MNAPFRIDPRAARLARLAVCAVLPVVLGGGCASLVRRAAAPALAPLAQGLATSLETQEDPEIVRAGAPALLLLLDGFLASMPDEKSLLLAAAQAQAGYAAAFYDREQADRARVAYGKSRDYALRALAGNRAFRDARDGPIEAFEASLGGFGKADVPALCTAGMAWAQWILANPDSVEAMAQFSRPVALMRRALELDPGYRGGTPELFFGIYCAAQPRGAGQDLAKSRAHFERAIAFAGPGALLPRVTFAEFYARYALDRELFEKTLRAALEAGEDPPELRLENAVARRRAKALLERADDLF